MFLSGRSLKGKFAAQGLVVVAGFLLILGPAFLGLRSFNRQYQSFSRVGIEHQARPLKIARDQTFFSRLVRSIMLGDNYADISTQAEKTAAAVRANYAALEQAAAGLDDPAVRAQLETLVGSARADSYAILDDALRTVAAVKGETDLARLNLVWRKYRDDNKVRGELAERLNGVAHRFRL